MTHNDPEIARDIAEHARMASLEAIKHPPGLSPEAPTVKRRTQYNAHQIKEALQLAKKVGVAAAAKACGVSTWIIYRAGANPSRLKERVKNAPKGPTPKMETLQSAARIALYWNSNIRGLKVRSSFKRDCFNRAAARYKINPAVLWREYTTNQIEGVPYP